MSHGRRAVLMVVVASLCVAAGVAIGVLVLGEFGPTEGRILMTSAALAAAGLLAFRPPSSSTRAAPGRSRRP